jgi:hypothetical protein
MSISMETEHWRSAQTIAHSAVRVQNRLEHLPYTEFGIHTPGEGQKRFIVPHIKRKIAWFLAIECGKDMSCLVLLSLQSSDRWARTELISLWNSQQKPIRLPVSSMYSFERAVTHNQSEQWSI